MHVIQQLINRLKYHNDIAMLASHALHLSLSTVLSIPMNFSLSFSAKIKISRGFVFFLVRIFSFSTSKLIFKLKGRSLMCFDSFFISFSLSRFLISLLLEFEFELFLRFLLAYWTVGGGTWGWVPVALKAGNLWRFHLRCWCWRKWWCLSHFRLRWIPTVSDENSRNCYVFRVSPRLSKMRLVLFPCDVAEWSLPQIFHHSRPQGVSNFINEPWWKLSLWITLRNVIQDTSFLRRSRSENEAGYVRNGPETNKKTPRVH